MKLKIWQKNILSMLVIVGIGFVLFNVAFFIAYLVSEAYDIIIMPFADRFSIASAIHFSWHYLYIFIVLMLSWFVFRTRLNDLAKASFSTMPMVVVLAEVGVQFYRFPFLVWVIGVVFVCAVILFLYNTKRSWLYYFATIFVVAVVIFAMLSGMEI